MTKQHDSELKQEKKTPVFSEVIDYYTPINFNETDYNDYILQTSLTKEDLSKVDLEKSLMQDIIKGIIKEIISQFQRSRYSQVEIVVAQGEFPVPMNTLLNTLQNLKKEEITPRNILQKMKYCVTELRENELPYGWNIGFQFQPYQAYVNNAKHAGNDLEKEFKPYTTRLEQLFEQWDAMEQTKTTIKNNGDSYTPSLKSKTRLKESLDFALRKITEEAKNSKQRLLGIAGICNALEKNIKLDIDKEIKEYGTLKQMNADQSNKILLLKAIQAAYLKDLSIISDSDAYNKMMFETFGRLGGDSKAPQRTESEDNARDFKSTHEYEHVEEEPLEELTSAMECSEKTPSAEQRSSLHREANDDEDDLSNHQEKREEVEPLVPEDDSPVQDVAEVVKTHPNPERLNAALKRLNDDNIDLSTGHDSQANLHYFFDCNDPKELADILVIMSANGLLEGEIGASNSEKAKTAFLNDEWMKEAVETLSKENILTQDHLDALFTYCHNGGVEGTYDEVFYFADLLVLLNKARLLTDNLTGRANLKAITNYADFPSLRIALETFFESEHLLTQVNFHTLINSKLKGDELDSLAQALLIISEAGISLEQIDINMVVANLVAITKSPDSSMCIKAMALLNRNNLFTNTNHDALFTHRNPIEYAQDVVARHQEDLLAAKEEAQEKPHDLKEHYSPKDLAEVFGILEKLKLFNGNNGESNRQAIINHPNISSLLKALKAYDTVLDRVLSGSQAQISFDILMKARAPENMLGALLLLCCSEILTETNRKLIETQDDPRALVDAFLDLRRKNLYDKYHESVARHKDPLMLAQALSRYIPRELDPKTQDDACNAIVDHPEPLALARVISVLHSNDLLKSKLHAAQTYGDIIGLDLALQALQTNNVLTKETLLVMLESRYKRENINNVVTLLRHAGISSDKDKQTFLRALIKINDSGALENAVKECQPHIGIKAILAKYLPQALDAYPKPPRLHGVKDMDYEYDPKQVGGSLVLRLAWNFGSTERYQSFKADYLKDLYTMTAEAIARLDKLEDDLGGRINPVLSQVKVEAGVPMNLGADSPRCIYLSPILVPGHFIMLVIDNRGDTPIFYYQDSLGSGARQNIKDVCKERFNEAKFTNFDAHWVDFKYRQQGDGTSCGPFAVENCVHLLTSLLQMKSPTKIEYNKGRTIFANVKQADMEHIRTFHSLLLDEHSDIAALEQIKQVSKFRPMSLQQKVTLGTSVPVGSGKKEPAPVVAENKKSTSVVPENGSASVGSESDSASVASTKETSELFKRETISSFLRARVIDSVKQELTSVAPKMEDSAPVASAKETSEVSIREEKWENTLSLLRAKIANFQSRKDANSTEDKGLSKAYDAANKLLNQLVSERETYNKRKLSHESFEQFQTNCFGHIKEARKTLGKHRDWSEFLAQLVLAITTLGVGTLINGLYNLANNNSFWSVTATKSSKILDTLENDIKADEPKLR